MDEVEKFYPNEKNLGKDCSFWDLDGRFAGCNFPHAELEGRTTCEGNIDDVCIYLKSCKRLPTLTDDKIKEIRAAHPGLEGTFSLPPGRSGKY